MQKYPVVKLANANAPEIDGFPGAAELAALRAWYSGMSTRDAVEQYLGDQRLEGQSSRSMIGQIRRRLATLARQRKREDLAAAFEHAESDRARYRRAAGVAIERLRTLATQRAYRKEAERLILWAIVERGKALSSLNTEDAVAYPPRPPIGSQASH